MNLWKSSPLDAYRLNIVASEMPIHPKVFISYSSDDDTHRARVRDLATQLRADGVDARLDHWHTIPGDQLRNSWSVRSETTTT